MNYEDILCIVIAIIALAYSIFYLIKGKRVKVVCSSQNRIVIYVVYALLALAVFFKNRSMLGIAMAALIVISGIIYSLVPSGYDDKGIYLNGRFYAYRKITDMDFDQVNGYYQLSFTSRGKAHLLIGNSEDKDKLKYAKSIYDNGKIF